MKTSTMKMPLPRTTSTIPFVSAFPTSCTPDDEDESKADMQVFAADEDESKADMRVSASDEDESKPYMPVSAADDTSISASSSTSDKEGENCTVSQSLAESGSKASDVSEPPDCPVKFDNLEDFFARVSGQIKRTQSVSFPTDQSSSIYDNISATSAETLAKAKDDAERLLIMPSQDLLLPENCSKLSEALSIYAASPDLSVEKALAFEKLKANLPHLSSTYSRAKKDKEDYYKKAAKKVILVDELTKGQERYTNLKDYSDKLECTTDSIKKEICKLKANLKDAKTKRKAIQEQKLSLAKKCFEKSNALDEVEAELPVTEEMKELADTDIARIKFCMDKGIFGSPATEAPSLATTLEQKIKGFTKHSPAVHGSIRSSAGTVNRRKSIADVVVLDDTSSSSDEDVVPLSSWWKNKNKASVGGDSSDDHSEEDEADQFFPQISIEVIRKIYPDVMPLSPSDRQEVAAPRSNGIKGNSQSAGKNDQNMKRKYKGDSIPSQSLAQQDEPIQQKNSHDCMRQVKRYIRTLCKKRKTYSRETLPPGITSTIPSTSAFLTSSTPANEDRTKAGILPSTSDNEGEKCGLSPSLANTRSKASDVIEPPDCPVKFDNLEDLFA
ncbi:hypothetical protein RND71_038937 [Anisodus tanguticus]|uniref:Uncharacterized protein n=1 Tax=Anisodus tanguticus TaxID=243964 RepID=A0AAE1UXK0_9SOLA|nr:hypothetical protein RND71_038937 [Anisodus tanguticus]